MARTFYLVVVIAAVAGCQTLDSLPAALTKPRLADREAVAKALPEGRTLGQVIKADYHGVDKYGKTYYDNPTTLEEKLAQVGAWVGPDGKLRDARGKEIYFDNLQKTGVQLPDSAASREEQRKIEQKYRVIVIDNDPGGPLPA